MSRNPVNSRPESLRRRGALAWAKPSTSASTKTPIRPGKFRKSQKLYLFEFSIYYKTFYKRKHAPRHLYTNLFLFIIFNKRMIWSSSSTLHKNTKVIEYICAETIISMAETCLLIISKTFTLFSLIYYLWLSQVKQYLDFKINLKRIWLIWMSINDIHIPYDVTQNNTRNEEIHMISYKTW